jgi:succinyl-CoA synthetase beta subunit
MKLYEFEGKALFRKMDIPIPKGHVASTVEEAKKAGKELGFPMVVKSQVLGGGRGKAGGIRFAHDEEELIHLSREMLTTRCADEKVDKLLIEERLSIARELYAGITLDPQASLPVLMVSGHGGMDVEELAQRYPQELFRRSLDPTKPMMLHHMMEMSLKMGLKGKEMLRGSHILLNLVTCYVAFEALTAEINPLIIDRAGKAVAADAKVEIDDSALFRQREARDFKRNRKPEDSLEAEAEDAGVSYVRMEEGSIGLIAGGAGLGMASMDMISAHGGEPANFLDLGGNATPKKTAAALRIVLKTPGVEGVLINAYGGINNCEAMAKGIIRVIEELKPLQTVVVKMSGHSQEEGWALLEAGNIPIVKLGTTEEAVILLLEEMRKKGSTKRSGNIG